MRKVTILGTAAALMLAPVAAFAQQQPAQQQPTQPPATAPEAPNAQPAAPTIQSVNIVDIKDLPPTTQTAVNDAVAKSSDADRQKLRETLEATPQIKSALEAKGVTSAQVIAASLGKDGALTLVTKKAS